MRIVPIFLIAFLIAGHSLALPRLSFRDIFTDGDNGGDSSSDSSESNEGEEFLENMAGWQHPLACPKGQFRSSAGNCQQCAICGPDLYERDPCHGNRNTRCEWCLSGMVKPEKGDFGEKCSELVQLRNEFHRAIAQERAVGQQQKQSSTTAVHFSSVHMDGSSWWKAELAVEMAFYLALIALVLAVIRFLCKARPAATYRTVQVSPPALDELDQKNIVRAAECIREKLGKRGYDRLEEEFI